MSDDGTREIGGGSVQRLIDGLLGALARRTGRSDPAVAAARRALEDAVSHAVLVRTDASAERQERDDEACAAAHALLAAVPAPDPAENDPGRRSHGRDTQPQSPRALRATLRDDAHDAGKPAAEADEAAHR